MKAARNQLTFRVKGNRLELLDVDRDLPKLLESVYSEVDRAGWEPRSLRVIVELSVREEPA